MSKKVEAKAERSETPKPTFAVGQVVRPTAKLLEHYPFWAKTHDMECKVSRIRPSYNNLKVLQGWDIWIEFEVGPKWLVCENDITSELK